MGEFELLARIRERLPAAGARVRLGSGDDAAVSVPGGATATSVDALVEGVHFDRSHSDLRTIGRKALSVALSDLAAMGAEPGEAYVVLGAPPELGEDGCAELLDGLLAVAAECSTDLLGGDLSRSPVLVVTVTVVGHAARAEDFVGRGGGRPGDALAVTGELGGAAAGLLLAGGSGGTELPAEQREGLLRRLLDPAPRLAAGRLLATAGATAMIDLSDGLGGDLRHLAEASGCGALVEASRLPLAPGLRRVAGETGRDPLELAVGGGEDYELLVGLPPAALDAATSALEGVGTRLTPIGELREGTVEIRRPDGEPVRSRGFDQFA